MSVNIAPSWLRPAALPGPSLLPSRSLYCFFCLLLSWVILPYSYIFFFMAKIKGTYVTNLSGRVGNVVYRNSDGENIASTRPASVSNPKTLPQVIQRILFNTAIQAESALYPTAEKDVCGLSRTKKNLSWFMSRNLELLRSSLTFEEPFYLPLGWKGLVPFPFQISKGSLPSLNSEAMATSDGMGVCLVRISENVSDPAKHSINEFLNPSYTYTIMVGQNTYDGTSTPSSDTPSTGFKSGYFQFKFTEQGGAESISNLENQPMSTLIQMGLVDVIRYFGDLDDFVFGYNEDYRAFGVLCSIIPEKPVTNVFVGGWASYFDGTNWDYSSEYLSSINGYTYNYAYHLNDCLQATDVSVSKVLNSPSVTIKGYEFIWDGTGLKNRTNTSLTID